MTLTIKNRIILCWEILTITSGHKHPAHVKQLSTFMDGYTAGFKDGLLQSRIKPNPLGRVSAETIA